MRRPVGLRWTEWHGEKHKELCSKNDFLIFRTKYGICQAAAAAAAAAKYFWNSVTRSGDFLDSGQLFKVFGNK